MDCDPHLGTGAYDPATYWSARAAHGGADPLQGVCVFDATPAENRCADRVQHRVLAAALRSAGVAGRSVLEYGCGVGRWAPRVGRLGGAWHGVDLSPAMCAEARRRHPDAAVAVLEDGGRIPHEDASFDLVYAVTVLHHNPHDEQERILDEMLRVLRPGGSLVLLEDLGERRGFNMFPRSLGGWRALVEARGLRCERTRGLKYWVLREALVAVGAANAPLVRRLCAGVDALVDPWLQPLLPTRAHAAAVMTFRRGA